MTREYTEKGRLQRAAYHREHREDQNRKCRERRQRDPEKYRAISRRSIEKLKNDVYRAYGDKCSCCGESNRFFLSLDHINGGGTEHRKNVGGSQPILRDIRKRNYPPEYRLLCFNCNCGRARNNGICPHQENAM